MRPIEELQHALKLLQSVLSMCRGSTVGSQSFRAAVGEVFNAWDNANARLPHWGVIPPKTLDAIGKQVQQITEEGARANAVVEDLNQLVTESSKAVQAQLFRRYEETPWYDFSEHYDLLPEAESRLFDEAFRAHIAKCYRAAVILMWGAASFRLREYIEQRMSLPVFNEACKSLVSAKGSIYGRFNREYRADTRPELDDIPDAHVLAALLYAGVLASEGHDTLDECRRRRNRSAHPGIIAPGQRESLTQAEQILRVVFADSKFL